MSWNIWQEWTREEMLALFAGTRPVVDISGLPTPVPRTVWDEIREEAAVLDYIGVGWVVLS